MKKQLKILQIIQKTQLRGAEIFACQLASELEKLGHTVHIAFLFSSNSNPLKFNLNFISVGAIEKKRFRDWGAYSNLNNIVKNGNYDIVQANAGDTLKYAVFSKKIFGWRQPLVFRNANKLGDFIRNSIHRRFIRVLLGYCDYFISVSENCRQDLIKVYPKAGKKSKTISIGTYVFEGIAVSDVRNTDEPVFINIASFVPEKNHLFLIDIFHLFFKKYQRGYLWLIGDGKLRPSLEAKVQGLDLEQRVIFFGVTNEARQLLKGCDVMILPSKIEGLPAVILEALAIGVPVISSNVGGIPEVIKDGTTGFCIGTEDSNLYLEKIELILGDNVLRERIIVNGKNLIAENFTMPSIAEKFGLIYENLPRDI